MSFKTKLAVMVVAASALVGAQVPKVDSAAESARQRRDSGGR